MQRLLLVEDSPDLQALVKKELSDWYELSIAGSIKEASEGIASKPLDLILLDVSLPDGSGFEFCAWLRNHHLTRDLPIIFLTGKSDPTDKVLGFSIGADDYIVKPFDSMELRARIQARLRKRASAQDPDQLVKGKLRFDRIMQRVWGKEGESERDLNLTPFEFRLLYFLASRELQVFDRAKLLKHLLDADVHINEETIYTHISALRRKLGSLATCIECLPRVGYRFNANAPEKSRPTLE